MLKTEINIKCMLIFITEVLFIHIRILCCTHQHNPIKIALKISLAVISPTCRANVCMTDYQDATQQLLKPQLARGPKTLTLRFLNTVKYTERTDKSHGGNPVTGNMYMYIYKTDNVFPLCISVIKLCC